MINTSYKKYFEPFGEKYTNFFKTVEIFSKIMYYSIKEYITEGLFWIK